MQIYEELKARGLIAQVTNEEEIRETTAKLYFILALTPPPTPSTWGILWPCA